MTTQKPPKKGQFKPGNEPWNKGLKDFKPAGMENTWFKPGNISGRAAKNLKPIGAIQINSDGYPMIKISETGPRRERWKPLHRHNWEQAHGSIPKGMCLFFRDGNRKNTALENLELITFAERMRRNTSARFPAPILSAIRHLQWLNKRINEKNQDPKHEKKTA